MPYTAQQLFSYLDSLGIAHETTEHPPLFTVEQGRDWHDKIPGTHCKNLFLKDEKGVLWLVVMPADKRADLRGLSQRLGAPRFSFAKAEVMEAVLGLLPGNVTPFALLNDVQKKVKVVLDAQMLACERVNYHPLHNAASTTLRAQDIVKFVKALGYEPVIIDCGYQEAGSRV